MAKLISPPDEFVFDTHTEIQNKFIKEIRQNGIDKALSWLETVKNGQELSYPATLELKWEKGSSDVSLLEVSENDRFDNAFVVCPEENHYTLDNLKIGQKYFWRVNGGEPRSFETLSNVPRFIRIDGLLNVRDIGGNAIRQGLLYRGSELDYHFHITEKGKRVFCDELKIKTEIDLRGDPS